MFLISTRCLFVLVLILLPFPTRSEGTEGFPKLDDDEKLKAAVEKIRKEDTRGDDGGFTVEAVMSCFDEKTRCFAAESVKNEVRLRNGYKLLGEECSADPALNQHLFSPPSVRDVVKYPIWQRHLLDANQPLCSPFKHLRCSKTTAKCECRSGLIWREESFEDHLIPTNDPDRSTTDRRGLREREKICIFAMNKPCQMREYPGDEEIDSKALRPEEIKEGIPLAEYFPIFSRLEGFMSINVKPFIGRSLESDEILRIEGLTISPGCGDNECSVSFYGQRQRVCAPRNWDVETIFPIEGYFPPNVFLRAQPLPRPIKLGNNCSYENHRRLFTISDEELSDSDFWAKRKKILEALTKSDNHYCPWMRLSTCDRFTGLCECIPPSIPTNSTTPASCVLPQEFNKCDMTNGIIKILRNQTYTRGTKLLLNKGLEKSMVGVCPENFKCHAGLDIDDEMEIYCTCNNSKAGPQCIDELTGFLMFPRVPSFPSDAKDMDEKWKIFNDFNKKAIQFEKIFKLSEGKSCDLNAEAEASTAVERIRRLDKKGTVMTKAQYQKLTDTIVKLTTAHQNGKGLCQRFGSRVLACNSVNRTCVKEDENILIGVCKHLADSCELEEMFLVSGKCYCGPKPEPSVPGPSLLGPNISIKSRGVATHSDYVIIVGVIIIVMK